VASLLELASGGTGYSLSKRSDKVLYDVNVRLEGSGAPLDHNFHEVINPDESAAEGRVGRADTSAWNGDQRHAHRRLRRWNWYWWRSHYRIGRGSRRNRIVRGKPGH
jgi:hypothetical protein